MKSLPGQKARNKMRMKVLTVCITIMLSVAVLCSLAACSGNAGPAFKYETDATLDALIRQEAPLYPAVSLAVFSDAHLYDPSLGTEGQAFEDYLSSDRKLLRESAEIIEAAVEEIIHEDAPIVLVPGDMTKDGERVSHELAAGYLARLENSGKRVYVIPGNHDVENGHSFRYEGSKVERVPTVTAGEFATIYGEFGYEEALYRDPDSLSYVAELDNGLWLLALDSCLYRENVDNEEPMTDGRFAPATLEWMEEMLVKAAKEGKAVIAMMHHGVVEHYIGQEKNYGEYIVDDFPEVSKLLAMYNVRLVFTGHYHAQDITVARWNDEGKFLFDIETGSLVTYPCPYRVVNIDASQKAEIRTGLIQSIRSYPDGFPEYARAYITAGIEGMAIATVEKYKVKRTDAEKLAEQVAEAFMAHFSGDEVLPAGKKALDSKGLGLPGRLVVAFRKDLVEALWQDLEPPDNNVVLDLRTGGRE
jgi:3',5'-cyclic AMP phosphodiesterase CpdA